MTKREAVIVSAYTGYLLSDFHSMHVYIEQLVGHPVFTHTMGSEKFMAEVQRLAKPDFVSLIVED